MGGVATHYFGWPVVLSLDALSFLVSAWFVARVAYQHRSQRPKAGDWLRTIGFRDLYEAGLYVKNRPKVAYTMSIKAGWGLAGAVHLVLTLLGERVYTFGNRPDLGISALFVARAIGTAIGPVLARRWVGENLARSQSVILWGFFLSAVCYLLLGLVESPGLALFFVAVSHIGGGVTWVFSTVILQRLVVDAYRGRVFAAELGLATLLMSASTYVFGLWAELPGLVVSRLPMGLGAALLLAGLIFSALGCHHKFKFKAQEPVPDNFNQSTSGDSIG